MNVLANSKSFKHPAGGAKLAFKTSGLIFTNIWRKKNEEKWLVSSLTLHYLHQVTANFVRCLAMSFINQLPALAGKEVDESSETEPKQ